MAINKIKEIKGICITQTGNTYIVETDSMLEDMGIITDKPLKEASKRLGLPIQNGNRIIIEK